jgi:hypothetical protein
VELQPALQNAVNKMEARRQATMQEMERDRKDIKVLSRKGSITSEIRDVVNRVQDDME